MYDGTVTLDAHGEATVALPDWFVSLCGRLCYQLTPLDGPAPARHVVRQEGGADFDIRGGSRRRRCAGRSPVCDRTPGRRPTR